MIKEFDNDPFAFYCNVEGAGYEWVRGKFDSEPRLVGRGGIERRVIRRKVPRDLFVEFAKLEPTPQAIRKFADRYGNLFERYGIDDVIPGRGRIQGGSTIATWAAEIGDMRALVGLWGAIEDRDKAELRKVITWNAKGVRYSIKTPKGSWGSYLAHSDDSGNELKCFESGDILWPARYALQSELNRRISSPEGLAPPRLLWTRKSLGPGRPESPGDLVIVLRPPNLLASMWLLFAQAISGAYDIKRCRGCGRHFLAGPGVRRPDAKTCNATCRQRKKRKRKMK